MKNILLSLGFVFLGLGLTACVVKDGAKTQCSPGGCQDCANKKDCKCEKCAGKGDTAAPAAKTAHKGKKAKAATVVAPATTPATPAPAK